MKPAIYLLILVLLPSVLGGEIISLQEIIDTRIEIDELRESVGLANFSWTDPVLTTSTPVKKVHFDELELAFDSIESTASLTPETFTARQRIPLRTYFSEAVSAHDTHNASINGILCCGNYGGSNTGSYGSCGTSDESACGAIDCDGLNFYTKSGTQSATTTETCTLRDYADATANRCQAINSCKPANDGGTCTSFADSTQATAGTCRYMTGCSGGTPGSLANYGFGTLASGSGQYLERCNGGGGVVQTYQVGCGAGSITPNQICQSFGFGSSSGATGYGHNECGGPNIGSCSGGSCTVSGVCAGSWAGTTIGYGPTSTIHANDGGGPWFCGGGNPGVQVRVLCN